ncbi:MAG: hypothetical protein RL497_2159 [Pseudomonadota bacterium]|jgi:heme iron utilization protein
MLEADKRILKTLLSQPVAALATLHQGVPAVSMVPFALLSLGNNGNEKSAWVIHISRLASHTQDIQACPDVALLVTAPPDLAPTPLSTPRASIQATAACCSVQSTEYAAARSAYLARFPEAEELFSFSDFSLFILTPTAVRLVAGFGRAVSLNAEEFHSAFLSF